MGGQPYFLVEKVFLRNTLVHIFMFSPTLARIWDFTDLGLIKILEASVRRSWCPGELTPKGQLICPVTFAANYSAYHFANYSTSHCFANHSVKQPVCALGSQAFNFCPNRSGARSVADCENKSLVITDLLRKSIPTPKKKLFMMMMAMTTMMMTMQKNIFHEWKQQ